MANTYHGKNIIGKLSDAQTLPNAGAEDSESVVFIGGPTNGKLWIDVYALTALAIASGQIFSIELEGYTTNTPQSSFTAPFTTTNQGGIPGASGTSEPHGAYYLLYKAAGNALDFAAGDLITQCAIPEDLFRLLSYDWVQLKYLTDANEESETVDAFVYLKF